MGIEDYSPDQVAMYEQELTDRLRQLGGSSGNVSLSRALGWGDDDLYWGVRNRLVDQGVLRLGQGRGGSVRLVEREPEPGPPGPTEPERAEPEPARAEADLYQPMAGVIRTKWVKDNRFRSSVVEITAYQGRRQTGGTWSRPDITVVGLSMFSLLPGKYVDIVTFEIKPEWGLDVTSVYEALAHRRAANRAYLLVHIPEDQLNAFEELLESVCSEAKRHGVGVIVTTNPSSYEQWDERVEAVRHEPAAHLMNDFLALQLSDEAKNELRDWLR